MAGSCGITILWGPFWAKYCLDEIHGTAHSLQYAVTSEAIQKGY